MSADAGGRPRAIPVKKNQLTPYSSSDQDIPDHQETSTANRKEAPLGPLASVVVAAFDSGKEARDDHEDVGQNGKEGVVGRQASKEAERDEQKGRSEQPVDVA